MHQRSGEKGLSCRFRRRLQIAAPGVVKMKLCVPLLLVWIATVVALDWNEASLLDLPWKVPPIVSSGVIVLSARSSPIRIDLSTSQIRGFQDLQRAEGGSYSPLYFLISYNRRLADPCAGALLGLELNGARIKSDIVSYTSSEWSSANFTLAMSNDQESNVKYSLAFSVSSADPTCTVPIADLIMRYISIPPKLDPSTVNHSAPRQHSPESLPMSASLYRGTSPPMHLPPECDLLGSSDAVLLNKVIVAKEHTNAFRISPAGKKTAIRLFCGIYTTAKRHESHIRIIRDTWGRKCTGFLAFSTATDAALPAVALPHLGEESYDNMWQKVRSIWRYIHHHFAQEYDYFLLGGDDMLYIPENLYKYLAGLPFRVWKDQQNGVYLGRRFTTTDGAENVTFNSGGAGYILDQRAVEILAENLDEPHCKPNDIDMSFEDVNVAQCLASARTAVGAAAKQGGSGEPGSGDAQEAVSMEGETSLESAGKSAPSPVLPADTRDEFQLQQFHPLPPGTHWLYRPQIPSPTLQQDWFYNYDPDMQFGFNCCSTNSISFHYVDPALMRATYDYLYVCDPALKRAYFAHYGEHYFETTYSVQFLHA